MSPLSVFHWLGSTSFGVAMANSTWGFAVVELFHLLAMAILGGAILVLDLRLMGLAFGSLQISKTAREFLPITLGATLVMFISGVLMLASSPMRYYYNTPFRIKLWLFLFVLLFHFALQFWLARKGALCDLSGKRYRIAGAASLLIWVSIAVAGRAVGYF
jgi:uncharacterized membrane protein